MVNEKRVRLVALHFPTSFPLPLSPSFLFSLPFLTLSLSAALSISRVFAAASLLLGKPEHPRTALQDSPLRHTGSATTIQSTNQAYHDFDLQQQHQPTPSASY